MGAKTKTVDTTPKDIQGLRSNAVNWLQGAQAPSMGSYFQGPQGAQGEGRPASPNFSMPGQNSTPQGFNGMNEMGATGGMRPMVTGDNLGGGGQIGDNSGPAGYESWRQSGTAGGGAGGSGGPYPEWMRSQAGPGPGPQTGMNNVFSQLPNAPDRVQMGQTPMIGQLGQVQAQQLGQFNNPAYQQIGQAPQVSGPGAVPQINGIPQVSAGNPMTGMRGDVRDVMAQMIGGQSTQSVDQLGGANSQFFQNMMGQLSPAFQQQRAEALAQAKAGLGNQGRGSALANTLGTAMNRSLGQEQATLANYATQGMGMENQRQLSLAGLNNQANMANQSAGLQGQMANQGADQNFLSQLLSGNAQGLQGQMANASNNLAMQQGNQGAWLQGQQLGQQAQTANQDAWMRGQLANQQSGLQSGMAGLDANLRAQLANQGADLTGQQTNAANDLQRQMANQQTQYGTNSQQANMDWNRLSQMFGLQGQMGMQNAGNYAQLLQAMLTQGVAPGQVVQSGGAGSILGPLGGIVGTALGGPIGGAIAGKIMGNVGKKG